MSRCWPQRSGLELQVLQKEKDEQSESDIKELSSHFFHLYEIPEPLPPFYSQKQQLPNMLTARDKTSPGDYEL